MNRSLAVEAELTLTHDGEEISVWDSDDGTLVVDVPSFSVARALVRAITRSPTPQAELSSEGVTASDAELEATPAAAATVDSDTEEDQPDGGSATAGDLDIGAVLDRHDLTVEIRVRYATVARLGVDANPSGWERRLATRLLRVPAAVRLHGVVVAAARSVG